MTSAISTRGSLAARGPRAFSPCKLATLMATTAMGAAIGLAALYPGLAQAQTTQTRTISGNTPPDPFVSRGADQTQTDGSDGGAADGWDITQLQGSRLVIGSGTVVSVSATGGKAADATIDTGGTGGTGGTTGDVDFTMAPPNATGQVAVAATLDPNGTAINLAATGGAGGAGADIGSYGTGGHGGTGGQGGTINLVIDQDKANAPSAYSVLTSSAPAEPVTGKATAINLVGIGGNGGDGGETRNHVTASYGGAGGTGGAGSVINATVNANIMSNYGNGIRALSQGGNGGNGGEGYTDSFGAGHGGNGGSGGQGGSVTINETGGSIAAVGTSATIDTTVDTVDGNSASAAIEQVTAGILAESRGGLGGTGGTAGGDSGVGGTGGAAGDGGLVSVNLTGSGIYQDTGGYDPYRDAGAIKTTGNLAVGVLAASIGGGGGGTADVGGAFSKSGGTGGKGGDGGAVGVTLAQQDSGNPYTLVKTDGDHSDAIVALSVGGGGGYGGSVNGGGLGITVQTGGKGGNGGDGGQVVVQNGAWNVPDDGSAPTLQTPYVISTKGEDSFGILAQSIGGGGGRGGDATGVNLGLRANVIGGDGGTGGNGGSVSLINYGIIQTQGNQSTGVFDQSVGGGGGAGGGAISYDGGSLITESFALGGSGGIGGDGNTVTTANFGQIITGGANATAVFSQSVGGGGGNGGSSLAATFAVNPPDAPSITSNESIGGEGGAAGKGGDVSLINTGLLATQGANSFGVFAQSVGGGGGNGGDASGISQAYTQSKLTVTEAIGGNGGGGGKGGTVSIANSGLIQTLNFGSFGVFAQSVGGGGGNGGFGETNQGAYDAAGDYSADLNWGIGGSGGKGGDGGNVTVDNYIDSKVVPDRAAYFSTPMDGAGAVMTMGNSATGVFAQSVGGGGGNGGNAIGDGGNGQISVNVAIGGNGGIGGAGGNVTVDNGKGAIATWGANSAGVFAQSIGGGGGNGGSATTGSGADPQYAYPEFMADQMVKALGKDTDTTTQKFADGLWDWKDNVVGAYADIDRLDAIYEAYTEANPVKAVTAGNGLKVTDMTVDIGGGAGGKGGAAGDGGTVTLASDGSIFTAGAGSVGLFGQSVGGGGGTGGASTAATANDQLHVAVLQGSVSIGGQGGSTGKGGAVTITNGADGGILTLGDMSHAMFAQSIGGGGGTGGISTAKTGILAPIAVTLGSGDTKSGGAGGAADVANAGSIETRGNDAVGMLAQSIGGGGGYVSVTGQTNDPTTGLAMTKTQTLADGNILLQIHDPANDSIGGSATAELDSGGTIKTAGINSYGILAQSVGGGGGVFIADANNAAKANGCGANDNALFTDFCSNPTISGGNGGNVTVTTQQQTGIVTSGDGAAGIFAQSIGGGGGIVNGLNGINLDPGKASVELLYDERQKAGGGGNVTVVSNSDITTTGAYAHGIFAQAASAGGGVIGRADGTGVLFYGDAYYNAPTCTTACVGEVDVTLDAGTINVSGAHSYGVVAFSEGNDRGGSKAFVTVNKDARITPTGDAAGGILIDAPDAAVITNAGVIDASGSKADVAITGMQASYTVNNTGLIDGSVIHGSSSDAKVTFNNQVGGTFIEGATVDLNGGTLTNAGQLVIGGSNSISKTSLTGNLVQTSTGLLKVEVDVASGTADMLAVSGKASLDGMLEIDPITVSNKPVTILSAAGGISLAKTFTQTDTSSLFNFPLTVSGNNLVITPVATFSEAASGLGKNSQAVAASLQTLFDSGASMDAGFTALSKVGASDVGKTFDTLGGQALGAIGAFRYASSRTFAGNLYNGCEPLDGNGNGTSCGWAKLQNVNGTQDATTDEMGYTANAQIYQMGMQTQIGTNLYLSGAAGYEHGTFNDAPGDARVTGDAVLFGAGLRYHRGPLELSGAVDGAYGWYNSQRTIDVGGSNAVAEAKPSQWELGFHVRGAYTHNLGSRIYMTHFADLDVMDVRAKGFEETGDSPFNLNVASQNQWAVTGAIGTEIGAKIGLGNGWTLKPYVSASLELNGTADWTSYARFADQPQADRFAVTTAAPDRLTRLGLGLDLLSSKKVDISLSYSPEFGDHYHTESAVARLSYRF